MAASVPPNPKLGKSQALNIAQQTVNRLATFVPTLTTELSPVTVYQPGANGGVGNQLTAVAGSPVINVSTSYGVWVAPDVNGDGSVWYAVVECFGAGGGAGGGNVSQGGGGGGGGEYAREDQYPIQPGKSYAYFVGLPGGGGFANANSQVNPGSAGQNGGTTVFDLAGLGLAGGVVANGGQGGDRTAVGIGGVGGTGSTNSVHFNGGQGGTNVSGNASDNPISLAQTSGMFVGNTLSTGIIKAWYIENDSPPTGGLLNDASFKGSLTNSNYTGGLSLNDTVPPAQIPSFISSGGTYGPNATATNVSRIKLGSSGSASVRQTASAFALSGTKLTVSAWIQCDPSGTWGNPASGSTAVIATNAQGYTGPSLKGYALYIRNTTGSGVQLIAAVGDGTHARTTATGTGVIIPTPGTWYYVVMTYNAGTLSLYVNNVLMQSASSIGYTSVPNGAFATTLAIDPGAANINWFFGNIANLWLASDCLTTTGIAQAFGTTPATGGAGGGASGGPSAAGGVGTSAGGATGGAGGVPATQPASLIGVTTAACGGFAGANAGSGNVGPATPSGGPYGGGGGGSGDMAAAPSTFVQVVQFTSAATYTGPDALSSPDTPYNLSQQSNPNSGVNSLLFAGGLATDAASGSKNTLLLLPKGLAVNQLASGAWTLQNILLTFTNAFPQNTVESILEVGYTNDTALPQTYGGGSFIEYIGAIPIPVGAGTITYDLMPSGFSSFLESGAATALLLGPAANPTVDAYNAPTGPEFYSSIYGPGAYDMSGNAQYPTLTLVYQKTMTTQQGSAGNQGGITVTYVTSSETPVAMVQPFSGSDSSGNQYAQGFTGPVTSYDPTVVTPGSFKPESWKSLSLPSGVTGTIRYKRLGESNFAVLDVLCTITSTLTSGHTYTGGTMVSQYWPVSGRNFSAAFNQGVSSAANADPLIQVTSAGVFSIICQPFTAAGVACIIQGTFIYPLD